jgi:hypothetical protein
MKKLILLILCWFPYRSFIKSLKQPKKAQLNILKKLIKESQKLGYYQQPIIYEKDFSVGPIREYEDFKNWIELDVASKNSGKSQSVIGPILFFEKTSGTSSGSKLIPYSRTHLSHYLRLVAIWTYDLLSSKIGLRTLKIFISVSPAFQSEEDESLSMSSDLDYFPPFLKWFFRSEIRIPQNLKSIKQTDQYDWRLMSYLLEQEELEIISIWNPSYLLLYLDKIEANYEKLRSTSIRKDLPKNFPKDLSEIWPRLKLISTWGDGNSNFDFNKLMKRFPNVKIQPKGLLSTEFPVSVPLLKVDQGHLPLVHLIYFEFLREGKIYLIDEVEVGKEYTLILSAPGGFHRYNTHDIVKIQKKHQACPVFQFVGRDNLFSDLVGEKLSEIFVRSCILGVSPTSFTYLQGHNSSDQKYYVVKTNDLHFDLSTFEKMLCANVHYNYARKLGQLGSLKIECSERVENDYYNYEIKRGKKRGDIKRPFLICSSYVDLQPTK